MIFAFFSTNRNGNMNKIIGAYEATGDIPKLIAEQRKITHQKISKEFEIKNRDGINLHGYLICARKPSNVYVFYSHGYRSQDGAMEFGPLLKMWEAHDYNFFLVDHRAHGKSGGKYISYGIYESEDNMEWLDFMIKTFGKDIEIIIEGQSMGAGTVLMMSGKKLPSQVRFLIADCGYTCFFDVAQKAFSFFGSRLLLESANLYLSIVHGVDMKKAKPIDAVKYATKPILFTHGARDPIVPVEMGRANYEACTSEKSLHIFPYAEHTTAPIQCPEEYMSYVDEFIDKYMGGITENG